MKHKFKKIQLIARNCSKRKVIFGAAFFLAFFGLSVCLPKLATHADPNDPEIITSADAFITTPTANANPDMTIESADSDKYSISISSWYLYESPDYPHLSGDYSFEAGKNYAVRFDFAPKDGYVFADDATFTLNGEDTSCYGASSNREYIFYNVASPPVVVHTTFFGEGGTYSAQYTPASTDENDQVGVEKNGSGFFTVISGDEISFTANPANGYRFKGWYLTDADQTCSLVEPITCELLSGNPIFTVTPTGTPYYAPVFEVGSSGFNREDYSTIEIGGGATAITEADGDDDTVTVTYANGTLTVTGTNLYSDTTANSNGNFEVYAVGNLTITANPAEGFTASLFESGSLLESTTKQYENLAPNTFNRIDAEFIEQGGDNPPQQYADIEFDITWTGTFVNAWINDISIMEESSEYQDLNFNYEGIVVPNAGHTEPNQTNVIRLQKRYGDLGVSEFTINGTVYNSENQDVVINDDSWSITVPGAAKYTISAIANPDSDVERTIIWANVDADTTAEAYEEDMRLEHGRAKVIAIYDGDTMVEGEIDVNPETGMGWATVTPGNRVVFEFVPEYGYQLTSVNANGLPLEPQNDVNQYTFEMPDFNIHFAATFERVEDVVEVGSEKVTSGSISIGGALAGGSAQLTVNDIELSADKITDFQNAAGDYVISSYLDIDLYNIFYKANSDEDDDVWSNKIDELDEEVTITIQLAEGIDANDIVIIHNIHNGEEYEIIPIESYDPATNTITFKTSSFSNYAIAEGDSVTEPSEESTPTESSTDDSSQPATPDTGASTTNSNSVAPTINGTIAIITALSLFGLALVSFKKRES